MDISILAEGEYFVVTFGMIRSCFRYFNRRRRVMHETNRTIMDLALAGF